LIEQGYMLLTNVNDAVDKGHVYFMVLVSISIQYLAYTSKPENAIVQCSHPDSVAGRKMMKEQGYIDPGHGYK